MNHITIAQGLGMDKAVFRPEGMIRRTDDGLITDGESDHVGRPGKCVDDPPWPNRRIDVITNPKGLDGDRARWRGNHRSCLKTGMTFRSF